VKERGKVDGEGSGFVEEGSNRRLSNGWSGEG
jgi:hypothetical protein